MDFEQWLTAKGFTFGDLNPAQEQALRRMHADESRIPVAQPFTGGRLDAIAGEHIRLHRNNPEKVRQLEALAEQARAEGWDDRQVENAFIRASRFDGPVAYSDRGGRPNDADVLTASLAVASGESEANVSRWFKDQRVCDSAFSRQHRGATLHSIMRHALQSAGHPVPRGRFNDEDVRRALSVGQNGPSMLSGAPSTIDVTGILSNLAGKSLLAEYQSVPTTWNRWCKVGSVSDFKEHTAYRLTMTGTLKSIPAGGEIAHVSLQESSATSQADQYGAMLTLDRKAIINDDLGAFMMVPKSLARLAAIGVERAVYTKLLAEIGNGSEYIFDTSKSKANYDDGATDSVLSLAGLDNANTIFRAQLDANNDPLFLEPKILLVPPALAATAKTLMNATEIVGQGADAATAPNANPWAGMFEVCEAPYVGTAAGLTNSTNTGWFLTCAPSDFSVLQVVFLDGQVSPMVQMGEVDFNRLGISWRVVHDFGVSELDYRGAVHLKGAA